MPTVSKCTVLLVALSIAALLHAAAHAETASPESLEFFEKHVRPLLAGTCYECHGAEKKKGGLRLNSRAAILAGGETGPAALSQMPAESLLIKAINYQGETHMPPKAKLKDKDIEILTKWVQLGLPWPAGDTQTAAAIDKKTEYEITPEQRAFWSFQPLKVTPPVAKDVLQWARSDIDRYLLASLEQKNLKPASTADKRTLIRRATYDLCGLPPSQEEIDAFLKDESPGAFSKVIDRLLACPQYGERWARHWLDVVRYADSRDSRGIGGETDIADAWRYRDWVVNALNSDMPYDQFIIQQIAGDLLPAKEPGAINADGLIATGLLTVGEWGAGDADKEKMMTDIVDDQVDVVCRSIMGLTVACARCHDHKFDPIPTADYYSLAGIFFSTHIIPAPGKKTDGSPMLHTPLVSAAEMERFKKYKPDIEKRDKEIAAAADAEYAAFARSLLPQTSTYLLAAKEFKNTPGAKDAAALTPFAAQKSLHEFALSRWIQALSKEAALPPPYPLLDTPVRDAAGLAGVYQWRGKPDCPSLMVNTQENVIAITTLKLPARSVSVHPGPANGVAIGWKSPIAATVKISGKLTDGDGVCGDGIAWAVDHRSAAASLEVASGTIPNGGSQLLSQGENAARLNTITVQPGDMIYLLVLPKGEYTCDTTTVEFNIENVAGGNDWRIPRDIVADALQGNPHADNYGVPGVWHFCDMAGSTRNKGVPGLLENALAEFKQSPDAAATQSAAASIQQRINAADPKDALVLELSGAKSPFLPPARNDVKYLSPESAARLAKMRGELDALKKNPPAPPATALAAQDGGVPQSPHEGIKDAKIHIRGSYARLGDVVPRRFPRIIAGEKQKPLGEITKTSGRLELAQWLTSPDHPLTARVMVNRIWQYHFGEGIVRTASNFGKLGEKPSHPELLDYLARSFIDSKWSLKTMHKKIMLSAAYQQSGEPEKQTLKIDPDNRLFGRMNRRRLEAEALRDTLLVASGRLDRRLGGPSENNPQTTRRMLYLMSIRSDRSSFGPLFDSADPAAQVEKRTISTVAPQALFMLNHTFVIEQTSALVKRVIDQKSDEPARVAWIYHQLFSRPPQPEEINVATSFMKRLREKNTTEENTWTAYCQALLCANEFVFVD